MNASSGVRDVQRRRQAPWKPVLRWLTALWKASLGYRPERRYMRGGRGG